MKNNITFIAAGAGSGKTFRVIQEIQTRLIAGSCRPSGLVATTFTIKAANELSERIRENLYRGGKHPLAERLNEACIGTVDKVCKQILARFAFEAGVSPQIEVLAEEDASLLFVQAVELAMSFKDTGRLQELADRLGQRNSQTKEYAWKKTVHGMANRVRENNFAEAAVLKMSERSCEEMLSQFPPASKEDLDAQLSKAIHTVSEKIAQNGDVSIGTQNYCRFIEQCQRDLDNGHLAWSGWVKLTKDKPTKKSEDAATLVIETANRYESHPRLHSDIRDYIELIFRVAIRSLAEYQNLKSERGLMDFTDLEQLTLALLENHPEVAATLTAELDLVVVDEFQDTSPLQLALFLKLAQFAKEVIWVGDVKQAIYGFRGTNPELTDAVVLELKKHGGAAEPLNKSYRSIPHLVELTNGIFEEPFKQSLQLAAKEVVLSPTREHKQRFEEFLGTNLIGDMAMFQSNLHEHEKAIRRRVEAVNEALVTIAFSDTTHVQITAPSTRADDIKQFRARLKDCLRGGLNPSADDRLHIFKSIRELIGNFEKDEAWTRHVTDARNWFEFGVRELADADKHEVNYYSASSGKSGGQKAKLAFTILASAITAQYGLLGADSEADTFRLVVIDEVFARTDEANSLRALRLFQKLGLQLIVVNPFDAKGRIVEDFVDSFHLAVNPDGNNSKLRRASRAEYEAAQDQAEGDGTAVAV